MSMYMVVLMQHATWLCMTQAVWLNGGWDGIRDGLRADVAFKLVLKEEQKLEKGTGIPDSGKKDPNKGTKVRKSRAYLGEKWVVIWWEYSICARIIVKRHGLGEAAGNKECKGLKVVPWVSGLCPVSAGELLKGSGSGECHALERRDTEAWETNQEACAIIYTGGNWGIWRWKSHLS